MEIKYWAVNYMLSWLYAQKKKKGKKLKNKMFYCSYKFGWGLTQP